MLLFHQVVLSTIEVFEVFSKTGAVTLFQSQKLVYRIFNFEMYSFVIKTAIDVKRAVELVTKAWTHSRH